MTAKSDAQLLATANEDPTAFRELYERYADRVHSYLRRRTRDQQAALDLTAETFAEAWLSRARFRDELDGNAGPWLFAIARNKLLMSVRRAGIETRARTRLGLELPRAEGETAQPSEAWLEGLDEALIDLPQAQREALRLRVQEDLAYEDIAAAMGTTPQAARVRVHRALSALRQRLSPNSMETMR
ncbi:MAG: RNA polymerase sigma factor [Solirubrobacteraceae bacterium]